MLGNALGQFLGGVIWAIGANVASNMLHDGSGEGLHGITKMAVKTYLALAEQVQTGIEEARHNFDQIVAEVEAERPSAAPPRSSES